MSSVAAANMNSKLTKTNSNNNDSKATNQKENRNQQVKYIASVVRALVTSRKPPARLRDILREYPEVECSTLPYRQLGYNSAEDLLRESGEFVFDRIGGETCITAKYSLKTAHIASMVRTQKSSKSTHLTAVKQQPRQPRRCDHSWNNKSSFSSSIFQKPPPRINYFDDRNKKTNNSNSYEQNNNNNSNAHQQQTQVKRQTSSNGSNLGTVTVIKDLRTILNAKKQDREQREQESQNMINGNRPELNDYNNNNNNRNSKEQQLLKKEAQREAENKMPRPILGQNNSSNIAAAISQDKQEQQQQQQQQNQTQQHYQQRIHQQQQLQHQQQQQQLPNNNDVIAIASSLILAQREQQQQEQQRHQQRAELLSIQQQQLQKAQQHKEAHQQKEAQYPQQQQQQQQRISTYHPNSAAAAATVAAAPSATTIRSGAGRGNNIVPLQDRLKVRISNNSINNGSLKNGNSDGDGTNFSPTLASAGSEKTQNPFALQSKSKLVRKEEMQPNVFQFNTMLDPITSLVQYCAMRRCATPEYCTFKSKFSKQYQCRVQVNGSIYSTYPIEYASEHMAKIGCASLAIEQIKQQEMRRPLPPCTFSDTQLIEKIYDELLSHPHGMFAKNMSDWFEALYQQMLPEQWWSLVQSSPNRFLTEAAASNNIIIYANLEADKDPKQTSEGCHKTVVPPSPNPILLPWTQKCWDLYITHCASTVEVWARLFGSDYSEKFDILMNQIDAGMLSGKTRPLTITTQQIYLVYITDSWHRVRVDELDKQNGVALCFFIDFGDSDWLAFNQLYICQPQFLLLPAQAVPFSLFGLEDFADNPYARRHLDEILSSKSFVGEILAKETEFLATEEGKIQVVLYDTSSQDDVNLNPLLLQQICADMPAPELKQSGVTNVMVTNVTDSGDLYLQILNSELKYVQKLLHQLIASKFKREQHKISPAELRRSNMFLICDESEGEMNQRWYRGALSDKANFTPDDVEFDIFYVDQGETRRTHISKIFSLDYLSTALSKFPRQAIKARLHNIPNINKNIIGRMRALMPPNCNVLVKVSSTGIVPLITVYRRLEGSDTICTINDVIRIEQELEIFSDACKTSDVNASKPVDATRLAASAAAAAVVPSVPGETSPASNYSLSTRSNSFDKTLGLTINTTVPILNLKSGALPKLKAYSAIPDIGDFFEVRVTMSATPLNFMIQSYKYYPRLRTLMKELQEYCENNDQCIPADMVEIGQAYAAKNPDGFYHRVNVVNAYNADTIHVCFCDFGDMAILRNDQLKVLPAKFRDLPKMAIPAKLYGISARRGDWTLDDCLRFRSLTVGQTFVSIIKRIKHDKVGSLDMSPVLELDLVDVKTDEDIYIRQLLLREERAVEVTNEEA